MYRLSIALGSLGLALACFARARGDTIEHNLVVEPNFMTSFHYEPTSDDNQTITSMKVPLPPLTLSPGDVLRVTIEFANGRYLRRLSNPPGASQSSLLKLTLSNDPNHNLPTFSWFGDDGAEKIQVFDRAQKLADEFSDDFSDHSVHVPTGAVVETTSELLRFNFFDDHPDPETIGKIAFELKMPTQLKRLSPPETIPYQVTSFTTNEVLLDFRITEASDTPSSTSAIFIVPEPGGLCLAGILCAVFFGSKKPG